MRKTLHINTNIQQYYSSHADQHAAQELQAEKTDHGREVDPGHGGHEPPEAVEEGVGEHAQGIERLGVPVEVAEPREEDAAGEDDQVDLLVGVRGS